MLFSSLTFLFAFLPLVLVAYWSAPSRLRNAVLLVASLVFYAWGERERVLILLACILVNWACGRVIATERRSARRLGLAVAVVFDLGLLAYYKYGAFAAGNLDALRTAFGASPLAVEPIALPLGISFFTFQALSYVIDVHRGDVAAEPSLGRFAVYKSFFPQLIAGPIVRYRDVAGQLVHRPTTRRGFVSGIRRFVIGLGKKTLIANTAAVTADRVFAIPTAALPTAVAWLGIACYTLQIYFDFSGYSDMAIGLGRMFGFELRENFRWPYAASSLTDFWRRWHISLSTWFRDYVYVPLGGNRRGRLRTGVNLVVVFALCGLWHGAQWTFVLWGLFHGSFLLLERAGFGAPLARVPAVLRHAYVMVVVMLAWVLFRADSVAAAVGFWRALLGMHAAAASGAYPLAMFADAERQLVLVAGAVGATPWLPWVADRLTRWERGLADRPLQLVALSREALTFAGLLVTLLGSAASLASGSANPFIYFRF